MGYITWVVRLCSAMSLVCRYFFWSGEVKLMRVKTPRTVYMLWLLLGGSPLRTGSICCWAPSETSEMFDVVLPPYIGCVRKAREPGVGGRMRWAHSLPPPPIKKNPVPHVFPKIVGRSWGPSFCLYRKELSQIILLYYFRSFQNFQFY